MAMLVITWFTVLKNGDDFPWRTVTVSHNQMVIPNIFFPPQLRPARHSGALTGATKLHRISEETSRTLERAIRGAKRGAIRSSKH